MSSAAADYKFRAMATDVTLSVVGPSEHVREAMAAAEDVFARVERSCTRFDIASPLMQANASPENWHEVPPECFLAIQEAAAAHAYTDGRFDPRILRALTESGYDRSLPFRAGEINLTGGGKSGALTKPWRPSFDESGSRVRIGRDPIDLGGIGKGLAVRWALAELAPAGESVLVEAGGDLAVTGSGPEGTGWRVGVENPAGGDEHMAVLEIADEACATSSVRIRHWTMDGKPRHHLIDPRTGDSADSGLRGVTVVGPDPAVAEVWSKTLFLVGRGGIRAFADANDLAALWIDSDGILGTSRAMKPRLIWVAPHVD